MLCNFEMMHRRRAATAAELAQGEAEMRAAEERMAAERLEGGEQAIEDVRTDGAGRTEVRSQGNVSPVRPALVGSAAEATTTEVQSAVVQATEALVPRSSPPNVPPPDMPPTEPPSGRPEDYVRNSELRTPESRINHTAEELHSRGGATLESDRVEETRSQGLAPRTDATQVQPTSARSSNVIPLFTPEQVSQLEAIAQQAPWLYQRLPDVQALLQRPSFMQGEEDRLRRRLESELQPSPIGQGGGQVTMEQIAEENRRLRQRLSQVESRVQEGDVRFATPVSQQSREVQGEGRVRTPDVVEVRSGNEVQHPMNSNPVVPNGHGSTLEPPMQRPSFLPPSEEVRLRNDEGVRQEIREAAFPEVRTSAPCSSVPVQGGSGQQEYATGGSSGPGPQPGQNDFNQQSMQFMMLMMQSLRELQQRMTDGRDDAGTVRGVETVRTGSPDLPQLQAWDQQHGPLQIGDWLLLVEPIISDLSLTASEWWSTMIASAEQWYRSHLAMNPLERIQHVPTPPNEVTQEKWLRLERRVSSMILQAVPLNIREELVASRRMSTFSILTYLLTSYSPGGVSEKQTLLRNLEEPAEIHGISDAPLQIRRWLRWRHRAREIGAVPPDPSLQLKGLNRMTKRILENNRELQFRVSLVRSTLGVDTTPTDVNLEQLANHLLAEVEQLALMEKKPSSTAKDKEQPKLKSMDYEKPDKGKGKGKEGGDEDKTKRRCKFYNTDEGCRKGKDCEWLHESRDKDKRRCWNCGSVSHMSPACTRSRGGGQSGENSPSKPKAMKAENEASGLSEAGSSKEGDSSMKDLLEEATKMLRSMQDTSSAASSSGESSTSESKKDMMSKLQEQLNAMKMMKKFQLRSLNGRTAMGLVDSGATNPLRPAWPGERVGDYEEVEVALADGKTCRLRMTPQGTMISPTEEAEPIIPMGMLTQVLQCEFRWKGEDVLIIHPVRGSLPVTMKGGCPHLPRSLTLSLIAEIEEKKGERAGSEEERTKELDWLKDLVKVHPVLSRLPQHVRESLAVTPGTWSDLPGNRRSKKRWKRGGVVAHLYAGEDSGFTLKRAWKQAGGPEEKLLEIDVVRGKEHDMLGCGSPYKGLLRAAMDGKLDAVLGGPNCRTRSVLRHRPIPGNPDAPRPIRRWGGEEYGIAEATDEELKKIQDDDVLAWRQVFLFMVATYVRRARGITAKVGFVFEQPAAPEYEKEVVSWWLTPEWKKIKEEFGLSETHVNQRDLGGPAVKPTTLGSNLLLEVYENVMTAGKVEVKSSKDLARWPPGMMSMIARSVLREVIDIEPKLKPLSWQEHLKNNHVPARRDCLVCQQTAQAHPHRRVPHPYAGTLSLDTVGPLVKAKDADGTMAKYFLVGALTWALPLGLTKLKDAQDEEDWEVPDEAPEIEDEEAKEKEEKKRISGRAQEDHVVPPDKQPDDQLVHQKGQSERDSADKQGCDPEEEQKEVDEENPPEGFVVKVFRMGLPMSSKGSKEVTRTAMEFLLRLKADGYNVSRIHIDRGHEFAGHFHKWVQTRGIRITRTSGDDSRGNGRAEVSVKSFKLQIRRTLLQGNLTQDHWPWALRYVNEVNRCWRIAKEPDWPSFNEVVLVRKRRWKRGSLDPTVESARYLCPAPDDHGHWIQPEGEGERPRLTRCVMRKAKEIPTEGQWLAIEREVVDALTSRRRLREKSSIRRAERIEEEEDGSEDEAEGEERFRGEVLRMIEEEVGHMMTDDPEAVAQEMSILGKIRKMAEKDTGGEEDILQTKIVSYKEVWKNWNSWKPSVQDEVKSLLEDKEAMRQITKKELEEILRKSHEEGKRVEILPSKLVYTRKPGPHGGKLKTRWVICGNFEESKEEETFSGGADAVLFRILIVISSMNQWSGGTLDVKTAFLNADMRLNEEKEVIVVKPPSILKEKEVIPTDAYFIPTKAVYGFRRSPRLWGLCRDEYLREVKLHVPGVGGNGILQLVQLETEPNLWRVEREEEEDEPYPTLHGLLMCYVDDMFMAGSDEVIAQLTAAIQGKWSTSVPDAVGPQAIRFLGMQVSKHFNPDTNREDWYVNQGSFTRDLLQKAEGEVRGKRIPITRDQSVMPEEDEEKDAVKVREAQKATGEALWLVTRTRPDLMFSVSRMGSNVLRFPTRVLQIFDQVKGYLSMTPDDGLVFATAVDMERTLDVETDASFAPSGEASHGAYIVSLCGCPVFWRSGRQSLVTLSTAESELVEIVEGMTAGESIAVLADELLKGVQKRVWTDSQSALSILSTEGGNWRTRHLRMRAASARYSIRRGDWVLQHVPGEDMKADLGTKALSSFRLEKLRRAMGMKEAPLPKEEKEDEEKKVGEGSSEGKKDMKKVLQLIMLAAAMTCTKAQEEEEEEEKVFEWMIVIYTVCIVLITVMIQQVWKIGWGFSSLRVIPDDAPEPSTEATATLSGDLSFRSAERDHAPTNVELIPDDALQPREEAAATLSGEAVRSDAPLASDELAGMHERDPRGEEESEDEVEFWIAEIQREEEAMWDGLRQNPADRHQLRVDDPRHNLMTEVLTTKYGAVNCIAHIALSSLSLSLCSLSIEIFWIHLDNPYSPELSLSFCSLSWIFWIDLA